MSRDFFSGDTARVGEYMTTDVATVGEYETLTTAVDSMLGEDGHSGLPVVDESGVLVGFVSARDLLSGDDETPVGAVMTRDLVVARRDMKLKNAARVILRSGVQRLPVVDASGKLVGIISHADVVRSQIERTTPQKVEKLTSTLESIHDVDLEVSQGTVPVEELVPTQTEVYADELEGRVYELERDIVEPIVVVNHGEQLLVADGHHRALAAKRADESEVRGHVVTVPTTADLGMSDHAEENGLDSLDDVEVVDYAHHPLVEKTEKWSED